MNSFTAFQLTQILKTFTTNFFGITNGLATFLAPMKASSKPTAIVLTGSKQGITNCPGTAAYNASKAAIRSLAESLDYKLCYTTISTHLLVPGWTYTGLTAMGFREKPAEAWTPEQVAEFLDKKMGEGAFYVMCPDNDVTEEMDQRRVLWAAGDMVYGRPPLSRWREAWKERTQLGMRELKL